MANSLLGNLEVYAQESLRQLSDTAPLLDLYGTNLSSAGQLGGSKVITRLPTSTGLTMHNSSTGFIQQNATSSAVEITYAQYDCFHKLSELEWSNMTPQIAMNAFLPKIVGTFANGVATAMMNLYTSSSFGNFISIASAAEFSSSKAINLAQKMSTATIPLAGRNLIILPTLHEALANSLNSTAIYGSNAVIKNYRFLEGVFGFEKVIEYASLPSNSENLVGVATNNEGLVYAFREPVNPPTNFQGNAVTATDPSSGLSIQMRNWFDNAGYVWFGATVQFGCAVGNPAVVYRIVTTS